MPGLKQHLFEVPLLRREPSEDEVEVTLFGKGSGECVVLHLGSGRYVTIDSFINPETKRPVAMDYLESMGVSIANIVCVVVSHWHRDHVLGIAQLAQVVSTSAKFVMPAVIKDDLFLEFLKVNDSQFNKQSPSAEFYSTLNIVRGRGMKFALATSDKLILASEVGMSGSAMQNVYLYSLSPNDEQLFGYLSYLKNQMVEQIKNPAVPFVAENSISTALWLDFLTDKVLIGGDLLAEGWKAIIKDRTTKGKASLFKVPHHGSITGHFEPIWDGMLTKDPISMLSVYNPSGLPRDADKIRIKARSKRVLVAGSKTVDIDRPDFFKKLEKYSNVKLKRLDVSIGIIRARKHIGSSSDWTVESFGSVEDS